jgi:hypothetical protein
MSLYDDVDTPLEPREEKAAPPSSSSIGIPECRERERGRDSKYFYIASGWGSSVAAFVPNSILLNKNAQTSASPSPSHNNTSAQVAAIRAKASSLRMQLQSKTAASHSSSSPSPAIHPQKKQKLNHSNENPDEREEISGFGPSSTLMSEVLCLFVSLSLFALWFSIISISLPLLLLPLPPHRRHFLKKPTANL